MYKLLTYPTRYYPILHVTTLSYTLLPYPTSYYYPLYLCFCSSSHSPSLFLSPSSPSLISLSHLLAFAKSALNLCQRLTLKKNVLKHILSLFFSYRSWILEPCYLFLSPAICGTSDDWVPQMPDMGPLVLCQDKDQVPDIYTCPKCRPSQGKNTASKSTAGKSTVGKQKGGKTNDPNSS